MLVINARNVNDAYRKGLRLLADEGDHAQSRNGPVIRVPDIVSTVYQRPRERVLFDAKRDANPFFHLFEALWMLNGGNDVATLAHILPSFSQFSDDLTTYHGAYGHRWRHWPTERDAFPYRTEIDQLAQVIGMLGLDLTNRRAVIAMWDPSRDLAIESRDIPCNDLINVGVRNAALDISVMCRSNDAIYGCYGANAVHMSMLQEYLAGCIGISVGTYTQISFDFHAYVQRPYNLNAYWPLAFAEDVAWNEEDTEWVNNYEDADDGERELRSWPLVTDMQSFDKELAILMKYVRQHSVSGLDGDSFSNSFFGRVAIPMHRAFEHHMAREDERALEVLSRANEASGAHDNDWLMAGHQWILRRFDARVSRAHRRVVRESLMPDITHSTGEEHVT